MIGTAKALDRIDSQPVGCLGLGPTPARRLNAAERKGCAREAECSVHLVVGPKFEIEGLAE